MGDTLIKMATEISKTNKEYKMWDKGQLVVLLSRTKKASDSIFVGDKDHTLATMKDILMKKTQWTDYMEQVNTLIIIHHAHAYQWCK